MDDLVVEPASRLTAMVLYTIFAWTAIVIAGGVYYWVYIREAPFPAHLLEFFTKPHSQTSTGEGISVASSQRRKRKTGAPKQRSGTSPTKELFTSTFRTTAVVDSDNEDRQTKFTEQIQEESAEVVEEKPLKSNSNVIQMLICS